MFGSVVVVVCGYVHFEFQRKKKDEAHNSEQNRAKRSEAQPAAHSNVTD
jgi:hypothetical protein